MIADSSPVQAGQIRTDFIQFPNRAGLQLTACLDYAGEPRGRRWAVLAPKYGETKKNNLQLAWFLAANGLNVLRFDHANHVGESAGDQTYFTLAGGVEDIIACGDYLARTFNAGQYTLIANSLSARTAIRAAARDSRVCHLVCLTGVVDLRHTLLQVYRDDLIGGYQQGRRWGIGDMLGVEMDYDTFLESATQENMHDLVGTRADLEQCSARKTFFAGERDSWVQLADVDTALRGLPEAELIPIIGGVHELRENPALAEEAFASAVVACVSHALQIDARSITLRHPDKRRMLGQNRIERERLRQLNREVASEREFWARYLEKYKVIDQVDDYQSYLSLVGHLLGPIRNGDILLDAGCGNGLFGLWVLRTLLERTNPGTVPPVYVGMDLTVEGLRDALDFQTGYAFGHRRTEGEQMHRFVSMLYGQTDLDIWGMPSMEAPGLLVFRDHSFDKICLSLVLSYLNRPASVLAEIHRVLRPGGRIVVSSMKPFCDMSEIYRDFMVQQVGGEALESGRDLLRAAGRIRLKEEFGYYTFYSGEEIAAMLAAAGFRNCQTHLSFGGQAAVVAAEK